MSKTVRFSRDSAPGERADAQARRALRAGQDRFINLWGDMGSVWGIPRTMAEIHALLYIAGEPLNAEEIVARLAISRGSASMSLKALIDWGLVVRTHKRGDRKEYFKAEQDVWQLFRIILRERKRREIDPVLVALYECRDFTGEKAIGEGVADPAVRDHNRRLDEMLKFLSLVDALAERFTNPAGKGLRWAAGLLGKAV